MKRVTHFGKTIKHPKREFVIIVCSGVFNGKTLYTFKLDEVTCERCKNYLMFGKVVIKKGKV